MATTTTLRGLWSTCVVIRRFSLRRLPSAASTTSNIQPRHTQRPSCPPPPQINIHNHQQTRTFFAYFRIAFNSVDTDRLAEVGPDRLCAEWLLKNGGTVTFDGRTRVINDYNSLGSAPGPAAARPRIAKIDATDASIMAIGFEHLRDCNALQSIRLERCKHLENEALQKLEHVGATLRQLTIVDCFNVTDSGLRSLGQLKGLEKLDVSGVPYVQDLEAVVAELKVKLPKCAVSISA